MNKLLRYIGITYLAYLVLALLVVTPLLNFLPHKYLRDNYARELSTRFVWFNPFTLSLEVREAALPEKNGEQFVAFDAASVNLSLSSIWQEGIVFDRLRLHDLFAHVQRLPEGKFNFSDFIPEESAEAAPADEAQSTGIIGVTVHAMDLQASTIKVTDQDRAEPFTTQWDDLRIQAVDFSTVLREGQPYKIALADEAGGTLAWEGTVSLAAAQSEGKVTLDGIRLHPFWRFAQPWVQFELREGLLHATTNYVANWSDTAAVTLDGGSLGLRGLDIAPKAGAALADTAVQLSSLDITGIGVDSARQRADVDTVSINGLRLEGFSEGTRISLQELLTPTLPQQEQTPAADNDSGASWTAALARFDISDSAVQWRSPFTEPPRFDVSAINAQVDNLAWPLAGETLLALQLALNDSASFTTQGKLALDSGNGELSYALDGLKLPWFNPALPPAFRARLTSGTVAGSGRVSLAEFAPGNVQLDARINSFGMRQNDAEQQFTGWDALQLDQLKLDFSTRTLVLDQLTLDALQGRVHIAKDGTLNTANLWQPEAATQSTGPEVTDATPAAGAPADSASPEGAEPGWAIQIPTVQLKNAAIDFQDDSLPIGFRTLIGDLTGFIEGINSDGGTAAEIDIKGSVDGYAPVALAGTANPLQSPPMLDLKLTFDGVDLARVSPYSGTYAGYAIDRGLLDLDLAYTLNNNKLVGKNTIVIDQLKLGDKVASDKALDIPLKLGISLLTNANGVIDMKIPVSGNLEDPSFKLGSVIASAFVNLITKAVTAPFSLLANLVSSDDDLQYIAFPPGGATLMPAGSDKLTQLAQAMAQRPAIALAVVGRVHPQEDRVALQTSALNAALLESGLAQDSVDNRDDAWLQALLSRTGATAGPDGQLPARQELLRQALAAFPVEEAQLLALAEARATAVKAFLVNDAGLATDRAVIEKAQLKDQSRDFNGVELKLEN